MAASNVTALAARLRSTLKNSTVLTPDSEGYAQAIIRWSDEMEKRAGIVVYPQTAEDISTAVLLSKEFSVPLAVCGGKHGSSGAASIEGGLQIDMGHMRNVSIDLSNNTAKVQGGCIWKDVDEAAAPHKLAMIGGTINHTGVGGLTLGGGYGWLTGRHGLTIDEVRAVTMVLADGRIVTASSDENQDLFWAVRGAGHCFGVAVDFTFQLHPQENPVWSGQMVFPASQALTTVVNFANNLVATTDGASAMVMGITQPPFMQEPAVVTTVFHDGPEDEAREIFKPLLELNPKINTTKVRPYVEQNSLMNGPVDYGNRKLAKGVPYTLPLDPNFVHSLVGELQKLHAQVEGSTKSIMLFEFFHMGKVLKPWQDMAHAIRGDHNQVMIGPFWVKGEDDATVRSWAASTAAAIRGELERVNGKEVADSIGEYGNYDALLVDPRRIFGKNLPRLAELKQKFDPENVFNRSYPLVAAP
ncbi:FAD-binding domain-containing protein [Karstenula rhodostoma CBS 690.94]|uniref:FAD-binding domain-containing protein n=1 Tax=Karstenula rhodostoma CBS 690.94 TaxID=1392251 RepID=A0A9P4PFV2_9PLEO|nr:FAD-binding domain-containing protein [Karstenula rhodostoma CBS 690.94]